MGQARRQPSRRAHCDQVKTKGAPQRGAGRSPAAFFRHGLTRAKRARAHAGSSHSPSHGRSPWDYFYSFCRVFLQCTLPMLSFFHIRNPCGERESFQTRNLGSYKDSNPLLLFTEREQQEREGKRKLWGLRPQAPLKIKNKRFKPSLLSAFREQ